MSIHAAVNVSTPDTAAGPVFSPVQQIDTAANPTVRFTFKKDRAPSAYTIQVRGRDNPTAPWTYLELYSTDTSLSASNEASTFNGTDTYEAVLNSYRQMQVVTSGLTNTLTPGSSDWPATIAAGAAAKAVEVYAPASVKDYSWRRLTVFTPSGYTPAGGWPVIVVFNNSGLNQDLGVDDGLNGGSVYASGNPAQDWLNRGFAVVQVAMSGMGSTLTGSPTDNHPWLRGYTYLTSTLGGLLGGEDDAKAQLEGAWAVQWVRGVGAEKYGLNGDMVYTFGRSGGGFQALWLACMPDQQDTSSSDPILQQSSIPNGTIAFSGLTWFPVYADAFSGISAFENESSPGNSISNMGQAADIEKQRVSPCVMAFNEALNPGVRERLQRHPFLLVHKYATSDTDQNYNAYVGSKDEGDNSYALYTNPLDIPFLTGVGNLAHPVWHGLQFIYMLRGLSRTLADKPYGGGDYWHDANSRLVYVDEAGTDPSSGWTGGATGNAQFVHTEVNSDADGFAEVTPWIEEMRPSTASYPNTTLDCHVNVWID